MLCRVSDVTTDEVEDFEKGGAQGSDYQAADDVECGAEDNNESEEEMLDDERQKVNDVTPIETDHLESQGAQSDRDGVDVYDVKAVFSAEVSTHSRELCMSDGKFR